MQTGDHQPDGYLALPAHGKGKGVLVLHAWWGLHATIRGVCDRLAGAGFVAFAPDLYHGKVTNRIDEAQVLGESLDARVDEARAEIASALDFLTSRSNGTGVAVMGFSLGGFYAVDVSARAPDRIDAVVLFYGTGPADLSRSRARYLGHFAEDDAYEPPAYAAKLEDALRREGRPVVFHTYPGTKHWFVEPDRTDVYDAAAANLAWDRTIAFLRGDFATV